MPINKNNITRFIAQLYREKKGQEAPQELLNSWAQLSDEDIETNLKGLFESWGMNDNDRNVIVQKFLSQEINHTPHTAPYTYTPPTVTATAPTTHTHTHHASHKKTTGKRTLMTFLLLLPIALVVAFVVYKYISYNALSRVYAITQNIAIRDVKGKMVGRMDLFSDSTIGSYSSLRALDKNIYFIQPEGSNKEYPCRKVIPDSITFRDYLFNRQHEVYVNVNYLVDDKREYKLYANAFSEIQNVEKDNAQLNAAIRKVIVGSMVLTKNMEDKYLITYTEGLNKNILNITSSIIIQRFQNDQEYVVIAPLNDGKFYRFEGNISTNTFKPLSEVSVVNDSKEILALEGQYRFIQSDGTWKLYNVNEKSSTHYELKKDTSGKYAYFEFNPPEQISTESNLINTVNDVINRIFN